MEWIRENADFKYINTNSKNTISIKNVDDLPEEFYKYSEYFFSAGNLVVKHMLETRDNSIKDTWFFPLIYLYRHAIELILKANVFKYIINQNERKDYLKLVGHNLSYSFEIFQMKAEIEKDNEIGWLEKFLDDITQIDKESDVFRYPFSNLGKKYFEEMKRTNLNCVKKNFNTAYEILKDLYINKNALNTKYTAYKAKLFIDAGEYRDLSVVGWLNSFTNFEFYPYINGYIEVANYIKEFIINNKIEKLFLPMAYLFRNAVELSLKRILIEDIKIDYNKGMKIIRKKRHSVLGIWNSIKIRIREYFNYKEDNTIENVEKYINILQNFDNSSSKFRYPIDKNMKFYFEKALILDVDNVVKCFNELLNFLDCVYITISEIRELESEFYYEY